MSNAKLSQNYIEMRQPTVRQSRFMDAREMIDAGYYRRAEQLWRKREQSTPTPVPMKAAEKKRNCVACPRCGTWVPDEGRECPFCFK